jgi:hypothetical protein
MKNYLIIFVLCVTALLVNSCGMFGGKSTAKKKEHDGLILVELRVGNDFYIDRTGKKVLDCPDFDCGAFSEGIAIAQTPNNKTKKFFDKTGKVLFQGEYESVQPFSDGMAIVEVKDPNGGLEKRYGAIDRTGKLVVEPKYEELKPFSEGLAVAGSKPAPVGNEYIYVKYGYVDKTGKVVIPLEFHEAEPFSEGFAIVRKDQYTGARFIDKTGKETDWYEKYRFKEALPFSEGYAAIEVYDEGWFFIDTKGEKAFELKNDLKFSEVRGFSEGRAAVKIHPESRASEIQALRPWTFIDTGGNLRKGVSFEEAGDFSEGLAPVKDGSAWIYVKPDETDRDVLEKKTRFEKAESFAGGLAPVEINVDSRTKKAYIDTTGKIAWQED